MASAGRMPQARSHLARCREIVTGGEDWRGLAGVEELTEAQVAAGEGDSVQAEAHFVRAIEAVRRYALPLDEAQTLIAWGQVLKPLNTTRAREKFDAAIEILRHHGYGQGWIDWAIASREAAAAR